MGAKAVLIFFSACLVGYTLAVSCYVCKSVDDPTCSDNYKMVSSHETDCGDSVTSCSKEKSKGKIGGVSFTSVNRTCDMSYDNAICKFEDAYPYEDPAMDLTDTSVWQCNCDGALCNGGQHATVSVSALVFTAVTAFLTR